VRLPACNFITYLTTGMITLLCLHQTPALATGSPQEPSKSIEVGIGIIGSSGLDDALKQRFPKSSYDLSGSGTLFDAECGFGFPAGRSLMVTPRARFLAKSITIQAYQGLPGSQYAVFVLLPGVSARYSLPRTRPPLYFSGEVALVSAHGDEEILTIEGRGISVGASAGVSFKGELDIELGYWSVPVHERAPQEHDADFGGLGLVIRKRWFL
jgi:hypothetical protein